MLPYTPAATPPAWLTAAYPEVLNADKDGNVMHHGHRRHYNYNSPVYQAYTRRIVEALGRRYGQHPAIVGWQLDNEINCEINDFYSEADRKAFRAYLRQKFGTLDKLNEAIGARFWNQTYTDWSQVDMERFSPHEHQNPHMRLLELRFISRSAVNYAKLQADTLRPFIGDRFITTNGLFSHLDNFDMVNKALDFITYDSYPNFAYGDEGVNGRHSSLRDRAWSWNLSLARALSPNFGIMEQQSGANGWDFSMLAPMPKPGQMTLWSMQSIAHGAEYVSYFRWRTAPYGTEIYWHGLNDYDNRPNRRMAEVTAFGKRVRKLSGLAGSRYEAKVALVTDYLNEWDGERDLWHGPIDRASSGAIFTACQESHTPLDRLYIRHTKDFDTTLQDLRRYDVLFYPHAAILTEDTARLLESYCAQGGKLVMGARTGYKDEYGRCPMMPMPGYASKLCGVRVADYSIARADEPAVITAGGREIDAPNFIESLEAVDGTAEGVYQAGPMKGETALVCKAYPSGGEACYWGSGFSRDAALLFLDRFGVKEPYADVAEIPACVEAAVRRSEKERVLFLLNYTGEEQTVHFIKAVYDLDHDREVSGDTILAPYQAFVARL